MTNYHINIFYSPDDEGYIADIPDLMHCSAFGETPQQALEEVLIAQRLWLDAATQNGHDIPKAQYRPVIYHAG